MGNKTNGGKYTTMKFKNLDKKKPHKLHYFVVDKSNEFSECSICGIKQVRKIIGW